jgi:hypothetical protein
MAKRRRRRRPGGHTTAVGSGGRRAPFSTDTVSHTHTARSLACPLLTLSSARPFSNGIFRSNGASASLPPASSSLTHARRMDGFCNPNADQLGSLAGLSLLSLLTVYVGVVARPPLSPQRLPPSHMQAGWMVSATQTQTRHTYRGYASFSDICGAWFGFGSGFGFTLTLLLARAPLLLATLLSHTSLFPRVY